MIKDSKKVLSCYFEQDSADKKEDCFEREETAHGDCCNEDCCDLCCLASCDGCIDGLCY